MPAALVWLCFASLMLMSVRAVCACGAGLALLRKAGLAGHDRAGRAGGHASPVMANVVGSQGCAFLTRHYRHAGRGTPTVPSAMSCPGVIRDCHALAKASETSVHGARSDRGRAFCGAPACPTGCTHSPPSAAHSVVIPQIGRRPIAPHELPLRHTTRPRRSTVNAPAFTVDRRREAVSYFGNSCEAAGVCWSEVARRNLERPPRMFRPAGQAGALQRP